MNSSIQLRIEKAKLKNGKINELNSTIYRNKLFYSKEFWILSVYFFFSILLLTGLHMYEYLKCIFCI
tara:strand:+ start:756 stop:956 length:201 start_codon:yes stop_codon:yes gene_type:complete